MRLINSILEWLKYMPQFLTEIKENLMDKIFTPETGLITAAIGLLALLIKRITKRK